MSRLTISGRRMIVQEDSLRATLKLFRFPVRAIAYICSSLHDAQSVVITDGGLTGPFPIRSSVRQGDPLSPLLYILFMDALHRGLDGIEDSGHALDGGGVKVASCGYADDLIAFAGSPGAAERMHEWVRAFFGMHAAKINANKTKYFFSSQPAPGCPASVPARLWSVCGRTAIPARPPSESFKYLGVKVSVDLNWSDEIERITTPCGRSCPTV